MNIINQDNNLKLKTINMAKKSKNITEIEHNRKMIEVVSFLMISEYAKKRLSEKKQYPNFNLKESEENIQKYKILVHQYQDKIYELEKKEKKKLERKSKKELSKVAEITSFDTNSGIPNVLEISEQDIETEIKKRYETTQNDAGFRDGVYWCLQRLKTKGV